MCRLPYRGLPWRLRNVEAKTRCYSRRVFLPGLGAQDRPPRAYNISPPIGSHVRRVNPSGRQATDQGKPGGSNSYRRSVAGDDVHELQSIHQQFPDDGSDGAKMTPPSELKL